jgi:uncharacterized membrane protein (UPF0127 family)
VSAALLAMDGKVVCPRLSVAETARRRMRGLLGRRSLESGEGLLLRPANSVHTAFMRFPIDVVFLDGDLGVIDVVPGLRPWRAAGRRGARAALELPADEAARHGIEPGMQLTLEEAPDSGPISGETAANESGHLAAGAAAPVSLPATSLLPGRYGWAAAALLAVAALAHFGPTSRGFVAAFFLGVLGVLAVIDFERQLLPNRIVLPAAAVATRGGLGMGDVKLGLLLGAGLGAHVIVAVLIGFIAMWPVAIWLLVRHGPSARKRLVPFGPALAFGAALVTLAAGA